MPACSYVCVYVRERDREGDKSVITLMCECQKCNYNVCLFVNVCVSVCVVKFVHAKSVCAFVHGGLCAQCGCDCDCMYAYRCICVKTLCTCV